MKAEVFTDILGSEFYTGVPDSQLKALCDFLIDKYDTNPLHHIIAANEGNATAIAAGYYLSTGKIPVVYMQNSGEGNIINPVCSLLHEKVYAIPSIFVIGWRGEPGVHDEPQHIYQGEITLKLLDDLQIQYFVIRPDTTEVQLCNVMNKYKEILAQGKSVSFVIGKGALTYSNKVTYKNKYAMTREQIIQCITDYSGDDTIVSTTGKASRELFEIRVRNGQDHSRDFLTVGSMGHSSSIALSIALQKPDSRIWCIDGDGAALMHMGAMAVIGSCKPENFIHILINNEAHETVGGMPTVAGNINMCGVAESCGYKYVKSVETQEALEKELKEVKLKKAPVFIEVHCGIGARTDLGRPTTTPQENKQHFMEHISNL